MVRILRGAALAALLVAPPLGASARADEAAPSGDAPLHTVSLKQAIALALEHNPDSRSASYNVHAAQGALVQASLLSNPTLFLYSYASQISGPFQGPIPNQLGATWTVPVGGKRAAGIAAAQATLDASKASYEANRRQLTLNVETAFVTALLDQALVQFAQLDQSQFDQELQLNELRYKDGKISYGDVLKLRVQALALADALRQAQANLAGARADLRQLVGEGVLDDQFVLEGELEQPAARAVTAAALAEQALAHRPDYAASQRQEKSAEASLTLARRTPIPDIALLADYNHNFRDSTAPDTYDLSVSVPIPVLDRNQGGITQAEAAFAQARLATTSLRLSIQDAAEKAVVEWNTSQAQLDAYAQGVKTAQESLQISKHAYELGSGTLLDYLDAEASYRQVESAYRAALARTVIAADNLRFVAGKDTP